MAKTSSVEKNNKRKILSAKYSGKRKKLKAIVMNKETSAEERFDAILKLTKLPNNSSRNRIRNRCELTGRSRGNYRKFGLCRIKIRELASSGQIPGLIKSSW